MSEKQLLEIQVGKETTWGTPVTPTAKLMGVVEPAKLTAGVKTLNLPEQRGSHAIHYNSVLSEVRGSGSLPNMYVTYEDVCYLLDCLFGQATPSGVGPYVYDYAAPLTSNPSPRILTLMSGGPDGVYQLAGGLINQLVISGESGQPLKMSADFIGQDVATGTLAGLSDRTVNIAMGDHVVLYIDAFGGTIGTTAISTIFYSFELAIKNERSTKLGLGALTPSGYREHGWSGTLKMTLEFDATSKAYLDAIVGASAVFQKLVRIKSTLDANHVLQLDFAGTMLDSPEIFTDKDGTITVDINLEDTYESTFANWCKAQVTNQVSALA